VKGQWIGYLHGKTNSGEELPTGRVIFNVDYDVPDIASIHIKFPHTSVWGEAKITLSNDCLEGDIPILDSYPTQSGDGPLLPAGNTFKGRITDHYHIQGTWEAGITQSSGEFTLELKDTTQVRNFDDKVSWEEFREATLRNCRKNPNLIFRGHQQRNHVLITSFHRTGRRSIARYWKHDLPELQRRMEAFLGKAYDFRNPADQGNFLNLAQHHGYPTPLLDWTESPFVAAFFAFREKQTAMSKNDLEKERFVRIYSLDCEEWKSAEFLPIVDCEPRFNRFKLAARDNPRAIPQQSINMFSNIVDIEGFVENWESSNNKRVLKRIDIPFADRERAMNDLKIMGISSASLFPGLDGICKSFTDISF
jgi:hypothetical protein